MNEVLVSPQGRRGCILCSKENIGAALPVVSLSLAAVLLEILLTFTPTSYVPNHKIPNSNKPLIL